MTTHTGFEARRVQSVAAEVATRVVMATLAQHRRQEALLRAISLPVGRIRALASDTGSHQVRAQSTLLRLVSATESYLVGEFVKRFEAHAPPPRSKVMEYIYIAAEDKAIGSWRGLEEHYKSVLSIKLTECKLWRKVLATNDARNAVAHGLGELTRRQTRKDLTPLTTGLASIEVHVQDGRLVISDESIYAIGRISADFIDWVDERLSHYDSTA